MTGVRDGKTASRGRGVVITSAREARRGMSGSTQLPCGTRGCDAARVQRPVRRCVIDAWWRCVQVWCAVDMGSKRERSSRACVRRLCALRVHVMLCVDRWRLVLRSGSRCGAYGCTVTVTVCGVVTVGATDWIRVIPVFVCDVGSSRVATTKSFGFVKDKVAMGGRVAPVVFLEICCVRPVALRRTRAREPRRYVSPTGLCALPPPRPF